jgi:Ankyrin repeat
MLLNMQTERGEASYHSVLSVAVGLTALHKAAMHNHAQLAQLLCKYGTNCNERTSAGLTLCTGPCSLAVMQRPPFS